VVAGATGMAAFGVDRLLGAGSTVVRALPEGMTASTMVAGARSTPKAIRNWCSTRDGLGDRRPSRYRPGTGFGAVQNARCWSSTIP